MLLEGTALLPSLWKNDAFPLGREIERLFEDFFGGREAPAALWGNGKNFMPALDVKETDDAVVVEVEMPGLKQGEIEVKFEEGVLSICAERRKEKDEKAKDYHRTERYYGRMERKLAMPAFVEGDKIEAAYKDGVLQVTLPKKATAKPKAVQVKVK
jgi:HSP20 family protein